jgi:hypothetical protein
MSWKGGQLTRRMVIQFVCRATPAASPGTPPAVSDYTTSHCRNVACACDAVFHSLCPLRRATLAERRRTLHEQEQAFIQWNDRMTTAQEPVSISLQPVPWSAGCWVVVYACVGRGRVSQVTCKWRSGCRSCARDSIMLETLPGGKLGARRNEHEDLKALRSQSPSGAMPLLPCQPLIGPRQLARHTLPHCQPEVLHTSHPGLAAHSMKASSLAEPSRVRFLPAQLLPSPSEPCSSLEE